MLLILCVVYSVLALLLYDDPNTRLYTLLKSTRSLLYVVFL